jgi:hypothetical protein
LRSRSDEADQRTTVGDTSAGTAGPAAKWLVDTFHFVEGQIREIRDDLPRGFYRQLPKLADGPLKGYQRVFGIDWAFVAHTDTRFDPQTADWPCLCLPRLAGQLHRHALLAQRNPHRPPNADGDRGAGSLEESLSETHALPDQPGKRFLIISKLTRDYYVVFLYRGVWKIA